MQWVMKRGSVRMSTGFGSLRDFANTKMNLPIPCNKGELLTVWVLEHLIFTKQCPSFKRFKPSTECVMVISIDSFADVP